MEVVSITSTENVKSIWCVKSSKITHLETVNNIEPIGISLILS